MDKKPFISVMILCYNYGDMLEKALQACAKQTFRDFEIVMINNGSTDNTEKVFLDFSKDYLDIKTVYVPICPNEGPIYGWNIGIQQACGEYIMFHDADDWMEPDCLERLAQKAEETGHDRIVGQYQEVEISGKIRRIRRFPPNAANLQGGMLQGTLFRRSVFIENNLVIPEKPYTPAYDYWIVFHFACNENDGSLVYGTPVYNYFLSPVSEVSKAQKKMELQEDLEKWAYPVLDIASETSSICKNNDKHMQMEYLATRHYYSSILSHFTTLSYKDAKTYYHMLHKKICKVLPNYLQNPLLKPFRNHYPFPGSVACWGMMIAEKSHLILLVQIIAKRLKRSKLLSIRN